MLLTKLKKIINGRPVSLLTLLIYLTTFFILTQLSFFFIHYKVSQLVDSLVNTSIALQLLQPVIILPFFVFILIQCLSYSFFVMWIWFITISCGQLFNLSQIKTYLAGIVIWIVACLTLLALNQHYFPHSFFAIIKFNAMNDMILIVSLSFFLLLNVCAYFNFFYYKRFSYSGGFILLIFFILGFSFVYDKKEVVSGIKKYSQPHIIFIGLDSLRPDYTQRGFTPHIDDFLKTSTHFTKAYTPLARTFPAWVSILTAKYPKHNAARNNLVNQDDVLKHTTLAHYLRMQGYQTIYATDEKRFSNITEAFGFDRILGPKMGVNDFLLGGLSDFPLTNLLINLPFGRFLFPYNYANRAAYITYEPPTFLKLIQTELWQRDNKPLFLAIHLCLSHWPFAWADDGLTEGTGMPEQYAHSVKALDNQFGELIQLLKKNKLLENSLVVLLSDHGTALGLRDDTLLSENRFEGNKKDLDLIPKYKLSSGSTLLTNKKDYTVNTTYGQGTNVLSFSQYHILLAFKQFGGLFPVSQINTLVSLIDITPTVLDLLNMTPMVGIDGVSLRNVMINPHSEIVSSRPLYLETGDSISEIETDHIYIEKVIKREIGIYTVNPHDGLLSLDTVAAQGIIKNKQLAVILGDWMLAHYPSKLQKKLVQGKGGKGDNMDLKSIVMPSYFVLINLKSKAWTIGLTTGVAQQAPVELLLKQLKDFYKEEL